MKYYVFHFDEDGGYSMDIFTNEELSQKLNEQYWGDEKILNANSKKLDLEYDHGLLIIKGECIIPKPIKEVEKWGVD